MNKIIQKSILNKILLLNQKEKISLEELSVCSNIFIHTHNRKTLKFNYLSENISPEVWNLDRTEVMQMGLKLVEATIHPNSIEKAKSVSMHLNQINRRELAGYFYQFIRPYNGLEQRGYYTIRRIMNDQDFLSVSIPLSRFKSWNPIKEKLKIHQRYLERFAKYEQLTPRQKEVFRLTSIGLSRESLAEILEISSHTVDVYRKQIRIKTGWKQVLEWQMAAAEIFSDMPLYSHHSVPASY